MAREYPDLSAPLSALSQMLSSVKFAEAPNPSAELARLAKARQREQNISYGEALAQIAKEHPELTGRAPAGRGAGVLANDGRGHFMTSSPTLLRLAAARQRAKGISHQDALTKWPRKTPSWRNSSQKKPATTGLAHTPIGSHKPKRLSFG